MAGAGLDPASALLPVSDEGIEALSAWLAVLVATAGIGHHHPSRPVLPQWWLAQAACIHRAETRGYRDPAAWHLDTGNGQYGGLQFLLSTWRSAGGHGRPDRSPRAEQTYRAYLVWKRDGGSWREWSTRGLCGLK